MNHFLLGSLLVEHRTQWQYQTGISYEWGRSGIKCKFYRQLRKLPFV